MTLLIISQLFFWLLKGHLHYSWPFITPTPSLCLSLLSFIKSKFSASAYILSKEKFLSPTTSMLRILHLILLFQLSFGLLFLMWGSAHFQWMGYCHSNFTQNSNYFLLQSWSLINILISVSGNITTLKNISLSTYKHDSNLPLITPLQFPYASIQADFSLSQ